MRALKSGHSRHGALQGDLRPLHEHVVRSLDGARDLLPLAAANPKRYPGLLESAALGAQSRYDILFAFPRQTLGLQRDGRVRDERGNERGARFLDALDAASRAQRIPARAAQVSDLPFRGGWLLFLGYELAAEIEPRLQLPRSPDPELPVALAVRCPAAIIVDRLQGRTHLIAEQDSEELIASMQADLDAA